MDRLYKGIKKFQETYFRKEESMFEQLGKGQSPDVLFFSCSDSRVDPNIITQSKPGEIFVVKNVGNIIPACNPHAKKSCTAAAIEFCLLMLDINEIVVCGHSDCGAMKALFKDDSTLEDAPNLKDWLETAKPLKAMLDRMNSDPSFATRLELTAKEHVILQLENLKTYPLVDRAIKEGKLTLHGWYYDIGKGEVHIYDKKTNQFRAITSTYGVTSPEVAPDDACGCAEDV